MEEGQLSFEPVFPQQLTLNVPGKFYKRQGKTARQNSLYFFVCFVLYLTQITMTSTTAQTLTASDDLIGHPVVIEAKPQQFIDKVMVRLEVLCNCRVIRLLHTLSIQHTRQTM